MLAQPIPAGLRFETPNVVALSVISPVFTLGFLVMGLGILITGIPPTLEEFWRILFSLNLEYCVCRVLA